MKGAWGLLILIALVSTTRVAHGQARDAAAAEALFRAGREASARGDHETACEKYRESYRLDAAVGTLLNLAACEEALSNLASAWQYYQRANDVLSPNDDRRNFVSEKLAALEPRVPRLTVVLRRNAPSDTVVRRGEVALRRASFGVPLPVNAGRHELTVAASGREPATYEVDLSEGERLTVQVEPGPIVPRAPVRQSAPARKATSPVAQHQRARAGTDSQRVWAYVAFAGGAASLALGGVLTALHLEARQRIDEGCETRTTCTDEGLRAVGSANAFQTASIVAAAVALVGFGAGTVLLVTAPEHPGVALLTRASF